MDGYQRAAFGWRRLAKGFRQHCNLKSNKKDPMMELRHHFNDGAAYERFMGTWSRLVGDVFLDWLVPKPGLRWVDVGCGNGAFTELIVKRCAPASVEGIDPSEAQIAFARERPTVRAAKFRQGDAMDLPFAEQSFDAAIMALVIFFVPDPAKGVAELARVTSPGGLVAAYAWDVVGAGLPAAPILSEMRTMGLETPQPPSVEASRIESMRELWRAAGLTEIETREIMVHRTFTDFEEFWSISRQGPGILPVISTLSSAEADRLKDKVRARLPTDGGGRITYGSRANAIKGRVPA